jgi:hypothetical protein
VDVAGPVPLAIEGARLAALAAGSPVPWPADDPDVRSAVEAVVARDPCFAAARLGPGTGGTDLAVRLVLAGHAEAAGHEAAARRAASAIMAELAGRFRRGIEIAVVPGPQRLPRGAAS